MGSSDSRAAFIIVLFGIIGLIIAIILGMMYENAYLIDLAITDSSQLVSLQIASIIVSLLAGCVLAAITQ